MYPMPKLADYGTAIETYDGDPRNPGDYNWRAHRVWIAPVCLHFSHRVIALADLFRRNNVKPI